MGEKGWYTDEIEGKLKLDLTSNLLFSLNSSDITAEGKLLIEKLVRSLKTVDKGFYIRVIGHTDNQQFDDRQFDNWSLSANRALAVVRALNMGDIDGSRLQAQARSSYAPKFSNDTD